jgi:hypothetical protein
MTSQDTPHPTISDKLPTLPRAVIGLLLAVALTGGVLTGAVLGPASASPLTSDSALVKRALALLAAQAFANSHSSAATPSKSAVVGKSGTGAPQARAAATHEPPSHAASSSGAGSPASQSTTSAPASSEGSGETRKVTPGAPAAAPQIDHVWLILLKGATFAEANAQRSGYPYLDGRLLSESVLLTRYSTLASYALAGAGALTNSTPTQNLSLLSPPACPSAATSLPCLPANVTSQTASDQYLQLVVPRIVASAAYRAHGLIVIAFGPPSPEPSPQDAAGGGSSSGAGSRSASGADSEQQAPLATLTNEPSQGALLLSPRLQGGRQISTPFDPSSPRKSLEAIFKR